MLPARTAARLGAGWHLNPGPDRRHLSWPRFQLPSLHQRTENNGSSSPNLASWHVHSFWNNKVLTGVFLTCACQRGRPSLGFLQPFVSSLTCCCVDIALTDPTCEIWLIYNRPCLVTAIFGRKILNLPSSIFQTISYFLWTVFSHPSWGAGTWMVWMEITSSIRKIPSGKSDYLGLQS